MFVFFFSVSFNSRNDSQEIIVSFIKPSSLLGSKTDSGNSVSHGSKILTTHRAFIHIAKNSSMMYIPLSAMRSYTAFQI